MTVKTIILACCWLVLSGTVLSQSAVDFPNGISLTIDRHPGWLGVDTEGDSHNIRCTFRNESSGPLAFLLADHSDYHGTLTFPVAMSAKVTDKAGNILTRTSDFGDWWTSHILSSQLFREMPGDRIMLKPRESVVRVVPLAAVLASLQSLRDGLKAGEYTVQLKLGEIVSNQMRLQVQRKK